MNAPQNEKTLIPLTRHSLAYSISILYLLFIADLASRLGVNVVFPQMQQELGLSNNQVGMIGSILMVGMFSFVMHFSYFSDKISKKKAVLCKFSLGSRHTALRNGILLSAAFSRAQALPIDQKTTVPQSLEQAG